MGMVHTPAQILPQFSPENPEGTDRKVRVQVRTGFKAQPAVYSSLAAQAGFATHAKSPPERDQDSLKGFVAQDWL